MRRGRYVIWCFKNISIIAMNMITTMKEISVFFGVPIWSLSKVKTIKTLYKELWCRKVHKIPYYGSFKVKWQNCYRSQNNLIIAKKYLVKVKFDQDNDIFKSFLSTFLWLKPKFTCTYRYAKFVTRLDLFNALTPYESQSSIILISLEIAPYMTL